VCHAQKFAEKHHAEQPDCISCHMPSTLSTDVTHTQVTDHRIPRHAIRSSGLSGQTNSVDTGLRLVPFPYSKDAEYDVRDLALAWEALAEMGIQGADVKARNLLSPLATRTSDDPPVLSAFGYLEQRAGAVDRARDAYERALALDPNLIDAATNLGVIEAHGGHWSNAVKLWKGAFERAPGKSGIGMNIAQAFCGAHEVDEARIYVLRVLEFNPDMDEAKELLQYLNRTPPSCTP
jgi:tetratricopeptide (TPR) repeat protein